MRIFLLGFALFGCFALTARYYLVNNVWQPASGYALAGMDAAPTESKAVRDNTLELYDGDSLLMGGYEVFAVDAQQKLDLTPNNRTFLEKTIAYLRQNPEKQLIITGSYTRKEAANEHFESNGLQRAADLRDFLIHAGVPTERIGLNDLVLDAAPSFLFNLQHRDEPMMRFDNDEMTFFDDNFLSNNFTIDGATFRPKSSFNNYMTTALQTLQRNPNGHLEIALYMDNDDAAKAENFAINRAQAIKSHIVALGLQAYKINMNIKINDILVVKDNSFNATQKNHRFVVKVIL